MRPRTFLFAVLVLGFASAALAGFLPLMRDRPRRDNQYDPASKPQSLPATAPIAPGATPTDTPTPVCGGGDSASEATFEAGLNGFTSPSSGGYTGATLSQSSSTYCKGSYSLAGAFTLTHGGSPAKVAYSKSYAPQNWAGKIITARLYFPAGMGTASAKLYIKSGGFNFSNGPSVNAPASGGWVTLSFDLSQAPAYAAPGTNTASVQEVGMELYSNASDPDGSFTVNLDSVDVGTGAPAATATITMTATPGVPPTATVTPTSLCGGADTGNFGTFEAGTETFAFETYAGPPAYQSGTFAATTPACLGAQALCGTAAWSHSGGTVNALVAYKKNFSTVDWTGKTLTADVYFPAGMGSAGGKLYVKTSASYNYHNGSFFNAPAGGGWVQMTYSLSGVANISDVREMGVDMYSAANQPDGPFTVCVDSINVQ